MRKNVLNHYALTLCQTFCGWQIMDSRQQLEANGNGQLRIDILSGNCWHNGSSVTQFPSARRLQVWLYSQCLNHSISTDKLSHVELVATISLEPPAWGSRHTVCKIDSVVEIEFDGQTFKGAWSGSEEWESRPSERRGNA